MKKKHLIPLIIILSLAAVVLLGRFGLKLGTWEYDTFEEFKANAYLRFTVDIPAGATDQKFYYKNIGIGKRSLYAFTLDETGYNKLIQSMVVKYNLKCDPEDDNAKYGYALYYMKKVSDVQNPDDPVNDFTLNLDYGKVTYGDISNYDIIVYSPMYSGTNSYGMIADPVTRRIVVFNIGNIR